MPDGPQKRTLAASPYDALKKATGIGPAPEASVARTILQLLTGYPPPGEPAGGLDVLISALPLAGALPSAAKRGIRAFHGSPHVFDKFSLEHIGTGEGAAAYGHGLYFAENPEVAADYARRLQNSRSIPDDVLAEYFTPGRIVEGYGGQDRVLDFRPNGPNSGWSVAVQRVDKAGNPTERARVHATPPAIGDVERALGRQRQGMYEVNINADPAEFLDWDARLIQQSPQVKEAMVRGNIFRGQPAESARGEHVYRQAGHGSSPQASEALQQLGIPGLRYLDQGSRAAGEGSRNYVIWDAAIIDILKKYGLLPAAVGTGAAVSPSAQKRQVSDAVP